MLALWGLAGCHRTHWVIEPATLPYKVTGASDPTMISMQSRFNKEGIRVMTEGQDYLVSIPSTILFPNESPALRWRAYAPLNAIVCYLKQFREIAITVTAYSEPCVSQQRDRALTLARARAVGDYLWSQGIDSRFIFTRGLGSDKPIVSFVRKGDLSPNSRVEITFRDAVA